MILASYCVILSSTSLLARLHLKIFATVYISSLVMSGGVNFVIGPLIAEVSLNCTYYYTSSYNPINNIAATVDIIIVAITPCHKVPSSDIFIHVKSTRSICLSLYY